MPLTYAVGDVHGSLDMLTALIDACRQHADGRLLDLFFSAITSIGARIRLA